MIHTHGRLCEMLPLNKPSNANSVSLLNVNLAKSTPTCDDELLSMPEGNYLIGSLRQEDLPTVSGIIPWVWGHRLCKSRGSTLGLTFLYPWLSSPDC